MLQKYVPEAGNPTLLNLASGAAPEIFDFLKATRANPLVTLVDIDRAALASADTIKAKLNLPHAVNLVQQNVLSLIAGVGRFSVSPQDFIYTAGLLDYLADADVLAVLNWMHTHLQSGGFALISMTNPGHADQNFNTHILEWVMQERKAATLQNLIQRSHFQNWHDWLQEENEVISYAVLQKN